ncbi:MAG: DUF1513 domain-containing protein [Pseudomonadota bacterium]|nr:DUF1513 domain-containing protein [Pseudomonadota bacterium]
MAPALDRRRFLASASLTLAASAVAGPGWAAAGGPGHIGAARLPSGDYALIGITPEGEEAFRIPLPGRGHAAAAHPRRPLAVAFARRPGVFGLVIDCASGEVAARLESPEGRHFYGHGAFSADGRWLYTCENAYDAEDAGRIGVWDADTWRRVDEMRSGGIGPHEALLAGPDLLAIANGGIRTHPDAGRAKLNLATMRPNLAYLSLKTGEVVETAEPPEHHASLRHIARRADGLIAAAMQWEGEAAAAPALLALHRPGQGALRLLRAPGAEHARLAGYGGSAAFSGDGARAVVTSPRGGAAQVFDAETGAFIETLAQADVCGAAPAGAGLLLSDGTGGLRWIGTEGETLAAAALKVNWDNHLTAVGRGRASI